jgi:hypothetical protein
MKPKAWLIACAASDFISFISTSQIDNMSSDVVLFPDAGPLITLAYADALDVLLKPGWAVTLVDMVLQELTRNVTPTSEKLAQWVQRHQLPVLTTQISQRYQAQLAGGVLNPHKSNLGELAIQETMNNLTMEMPLKQAVFLFEDHKIARASFLLPHNCRKVSTRAYLMFLQEKGWITSALEIERKAIQAGRAFSSMRFPVVASSD